MNVLLERLTKSSQIANGVDTILNTFESRLSRLEDTILPVYNETENLHKTKQSILVQVLSVILFYIVIVCMHYNF